MKVTLEKGKDNIHILSRKKCRQLERKLVKAKQNAWHHGQKVRYFLLILFYLLK